MIDRAGPEPPGAGALRAALAGAAEAAVLTDGADVVRWFNDAAGRLLPLRAGEPLPEQLRGEGEREIGERCFEVRRRELPDGSVCHHLTDITDRRALEVERARRALLARAGRVFAAPLDVPRLLRSALDLLAEYGLRRCAVVLVDGERDRMVERWDDAEPREWWPSPLRPRWGAGPDVHYDTEQDGPPEWCGELAVFELRSHGSPFGMLLVPASEPVDHELLRTFAGQLAAGVHTATLHERSSDHAEMLRRSLTQRELPSIDGVALSAAFRPAAERDRLGGDFYEVVPNSSGWAFALGDVCGKGVEAAVLSGQTRHVLHTAAFLDLAPSARLDLLNRVICGERTRRFVTLVCGDLRVAEDGRVRIAFANGGHPRPVVLGRDGDPREVAAHGMLVGALEQARFTDTEVELHPGETMLLYTDGVTEARDPAGEFFGTERLLRLLGECAGLPAPAITARVELEVFEFLRGARHDDVAVLAVQATGRA